MSWRDFHSASEKLAAAAHQALRTGDHAYALTLFSEAARSEQEALSQLDASAKPRTFGITGVSAVALWFKSGELDHAESVAYKILATPKIEAFAASQLRALLQTIWNARAQQAAGVTFVPGQVQVSVRGGEIVSGGAPLELIVEKVQTIQSLFYRTTEWLQKMPLRRHGPAPREIQAICRPWLFQGVPASYQFVVAVQRPKQVDWVTPDSIDPQAVATTFLSILRQAVENPTEGLMAVVPDKEYRTAFLKLTKTLSPTGKAFDQLEVRAAGENNSIVLGPELRRTIGQALRREQPTTSDEMTPDIVKGVLRAVHLDEDWLEVTVDGAGVRIVSVGEALDDVLGPMVNHQVVVHILKDARGKRHFRDIDRDE